MLLVSIIIMSLSFSSQSRNTSVFMLTVHVLIVYHKYIYILVMLALIAVFGCIWTHLITSVGNNCRAQMVERVMLERKE